jgi:hypothetical protein
MSSFKNVIIIGVSLFYLSFSTPSKHDDETVD